MTTRVQANTPDLILHPGDKAPYQGVLVSPDHYREMSVEHFRLKDIDQNVDKYLTSPPPVLIESSKNNFFLSGLILGAVACLVLCH